MHNIYVHRSQPIIRLPSFAAKLSKTSQTSAVTAEEEREKKKKKKDQSLHTVVWNKFIELKIAAQLKLATQTATYGTPATDSRQHSMWPLTITLHDRVPWAQEYELFPVCCSFAHGSF